jgi:hypothetical protein
MHLNGRFVAAALGIAALGVGSLATAVVLPGGGPAKSDCYAVLDVMGGTAVGNGKTTVECTDGDPACDGDGACNDSVTFKVRACANRAGLSGCTPPSALSSLTGTGALAAIQPPALTGSACGAILDVQGPVKRKKNGKAKKSVVKGGLKAKAVSTRPPKDGDKSRLVSKERIGACPPQPTTTTTVPDSVTTTSTTSTTSTTVICEAGACCGAEQIVLVSTAGTLQVDALPPFPFPTGVMTTMNVGAPDANCGHDVVVPAGGFFVPVFDLPALNYCSQVVATGCEAGGGVGSGRLWDGHAPTGVALTNVTKRGDSADGVCDTTAITPGTCAGGARDGLPCAQATQCPPTPGSTTAGVCSTAGSGFGGCNTTPTGAGANTLGDIDSVKEGSSTCGVRSAIDIPVHSTTWSDSVCSPAITPGCCPGSNYNPGDGDLLITEFDFILSPTTNVGTGIFQDKNANVCNRAGSGYAGVSCKDSECTGVATPCPLCTGPGDGTYECAPADCTGAGLPCTCCTGAGTGPTCGPILSNPTGPDGPTSLTGSPATGPCCTVGQPTSVVSVGIGFSGGAPLYDLGFRSIIPNTIAACNAPGTGDCTLTTNACLN